MACNSFKIIFLTKTTQQSAKVKKKYVFNEEAIMY